MLFLRRTWRPAPQLRSAFVQRGIDHHRDRGIAAQRIATLDLRRLATVQSRVSALRAGCHPFTISASDRRRGPGAISVLPQERSRTNPLGETAMVERIPTNFRRVITAAAGGNVIEWYDFYIFGSLAVSVLSVKFFEKGHPSAALITTVGIFTAGFLIRPLGAFLFGWLGDRVGRKYTFLITLTGMALGTGCIGLIPTFQEIGLAAAFILFGLRMIQGLCLGGEYGGAITYVAEHVPDERRGYYTGWLQTSPTLGIVAALAVVLLTRYFGEASFNEDWGSWRWPFLFSFLLVAIAIYIRLQLGETPIFEEIKAKGGTTRNPWKEAFLSENIKYIVVASIVVIGEGVVWYSDQFWALYFLQQVVKMDLLTSSIIVMAALLIGTPTLILWGWASDHIGRKPVILGGFLLAAVTYYPLYAWLGSVTQA